MRDLLSDSSVEIPLSLEQRRDQVCTRFENVWRNGGRPRIEEFVNDLVEPERSALFRELVILDALYRSDQGEQPTALEYEARFPAETAIIRAAFARAAVEPPTASMAHDPAHTPIVGHAGRTELYEEIGRGGMGRIPRGRDPLLGRDLAVKVMREEHDGDLSVEPRLHGREARGSRASSSTPASCLFMTWGASPMGDPTSR